MYAKATDNEGATASSSGVSVTSVLGTNTSTYTEDFNDNFDVEKGKISNVELDNQLKKIVKEF